MGDIIQLLYSIEIHSVEGIERYFKEGGNPNDVHDGKPIFTSMVEMYTRSPRFKDCVKAFINYGLAFEDLPLLAVLTDNEYALKDLLLKNPSLVTKTYNFCNNTYTPLTGATLLHYCAEYNCVGCARTLVHFGADINSMAAVDEHGFGGHTPVFHAVNQNNNNSADMLQYLLGLGVDLSLTIKGLIWGKGYEWETFLPSVNPISYAMMGLLPQMHRSEKTIAAVVSLLIQKAYGIHYVQRNVPCAYLQH